jgi:phage gp46-like protein
VRLLVTPARARPPAQQWEAWLADSAVGTKEYEKQIEKLTQPRRPVLVERHTCERCQPVCKGGAIQSIDTAPVLTSSAPHRDGHLTLT